MNFSTILALVLQALTLRNVTFAVTVGAQHYSINIAETATPSGMAFLALLQVVAAILTEQTGVLHFGVFQVTITPLVPAGSAAVAASATATAPTVSKVVA